MNIKRKRVKNFTVIIITVMLTVIELISCTQVNISPVMTEETTVSPTPETQNTEASETENLYSGSVTDKQLAAENNQKPTTEVASVGKYNYGEIIISSFYATGKNNGTPVFNNYIELYNTDEEDIKLDGLAIFYSKGKEYREFRFGDGAIIPANGYYLIRGTDPAAAVHTKESVQVLKTDDYDVMWDILLDDENVRLVIAPAGTVIDPAKPLSEVSGIYEWVSTNKLDEGSEYHYTDNLSSNKLVRKDAKAKGVGYGKINLRKASYTILEQIRPCSSRGDVNTEVMSVIPEVRFSRNGGIYDKEFELEMSCPDGWTIYYTINGDDPRDSVALYNYSEPLKLTDTSQMTWGELVKRSSYYLGQAYLPNVISQVGGTVVKAYATNGTDSTQLTTMTYFIGTALGNCGLDILSMTMAPDDLLSSEKGIYNTVMNDVTGKHAKVDAYLEYYGKDGDMGFSSWIEVAMNGKGSLGMTQKSFRLLFKSDACDTVGENLPMLDYDVFGANATITESGEKLTFFKRILLRNGGGDNSGCTISRSHLGDAFIARADSGLNVDTMAYMPVLLFINGEFWGVINARERFDAEYFETAYGIPEDDIVMLECPYPLTYGWNADYMVAFGDEGDEEPFHELVNFIINNDMNNPDNFAYVEEQLDLDNFIDHFCAQIYLCCSDWPSNNIKVWRNKNTDSTSGFDNKWRFCIVDTDHGCGLNSDITTNLFDVINDSSVAGRMMNHLLNNRDFKKKFIERFVWCCEVYYTPERLIPMLDGMFENLFPVMQLQLDRFRVTDGSVTTWDKWYSYNGIMKNFISNRATAAKKQLCAKFGLSDTQYKNYYSIAVKLWGSRYDG